MFSWLVRVPDTPVEALNVLVNHTKYHKKFIFVRKQEKFRKLRHQYTDSPYAFNVFCQGCKIFQMNNGKST